MPSHVQPRKIIINGHPTSIRLELAFWGWLREIAAECGMTAKAFIEGVVAAKDPKCPLASALRLYIANYFRSSAPRYGLVDPASRLAFRIERPRRSRKGSKKTTVEIKPPVQDGIDNPVVVRQDSNVQVYVLSSIVSAPSASRVHIVAHSMGTMLALESLRQLYARYGDTVNGRIGAVVFAAPDIDMDVFSSAITRIGPLAGKITVIASTNDRALALSGRLAGGMTRVGAAEKAAIERLGVRVIDASDTGWGIINHDLFLSNAEVLKVIRRSIDTAAS